MWDKHASLCIFPLLLQFFKLSLFIFDTFHCRQTPCLAQAPTQPHCSHQSPRLSAVFRWTLPFILDRTFSVCLIPFVCNFVVKVVFVACVLAIVFTTKVWCSFCPCSSYQSFNLNCTQFSKGFSCSGRLFDKLPFYCFPFNHVWINCCIFSLYIYCRCYDWSKINSSDVLCRRLSVWGVYLNSNTLPCQNYFFRSKGVYIIFTCRNSGGWRSYFWNSREDGELRWNFLQCGGMDKFWNYTLQFHNTKNQNNIKWNVSTPYQCLCQSVNLRHSHP